MTTPTTQREADERVQKALAAITERLALTYRICCGTSPKQSVGELLDVTIKMPEWEVVRAALTASVAAPEASAIARDWPEDAAHENGNYMCKCSTCGNTFIGYKRRITCKACAHPAATNQPSAGQVDERALFEAWLRSRWPNAYRPIDEKTVTGSYVFTENNLLWEAWQTRASLTPTAPAEQLRKVDAVLEHCQRHHAHVNGTRAKLLEAREIIAATPTAPDMRDAYVGAREDLAIWKKRALEAEDSCRRLTAALNAENGPTFMGEPATPTAPQAASQQAETFCDANCVWTDHHPECKIAAPQAATTASTSTIKTWQERMPAPRIEYQCAMNCSPKSEGKDCGDCYPVKVHGDPTAARDAEIADLRAALARAPLPSQQVQAVDVARDAARLDMIERETKKLGYFYIHNNKARYDMAGLSIHIDSLRAALDGVIERAQSRTNTTGGNEE